MLYKFFTLIILFLIGWIIYKDRRYLKKNTRDVVSDDMKKILNIPMPDDKFNEDIQRHTSKASASKKITCATPSFA